MSDSPEIETKELQEHVEEAHHDAAKDGAAWTRYVALSTAAFAAFAAVGALHAGSLVNRAMMDQIRAADAWNEYQADKQKAHSFTIETNRLLDAGTAPKVLTPPPTSSSRVARGTSKTRDLSAPHVSSSRSQRGTSGERDLSALPNLAKTITPKSPSARLAEYQSEASRELDKSTKLSEEAKKLEREAEGRLETHERFAYSVALLQVAIALGAVAAIARSKPVWYASAVVGVIGIVYFAVGFGA